MDNNGVKTFNMEKGQKGRRGIGDEEDIWGKCGGSGDLWMEENLVEEVQFSHKGK